jgi:hypothetical protein
MGRKYTTSEACIYCGGKAGSEEHVFPQWLRERFQGIGTLEHKVNIKSPIRFKRGVKDVRVVVRSVCKKCNETWMSGLQNDAKPIIEALLDETATALDAEECKLLSSWAVMSAMCLETRNERPVWHYTDFDRTLFYTKRMIPNDTEVWICYWVNSPGPAYDGSNQANNEEKGYVATFGFGNILFQLFHVVPIDSEKRLSKKLTIQEPWTELLRPIRYPKDLPIRWRPRKEIDGDRGFQALHSRFLHPDAIKL